MKFKKLWVLMVGVLFWVSMAEAATDKKDHPVIKPIPGFTLDKSEFKNFSSFIFRYEQNSQDIEKTAKGKHWFLYYEYQKGDRKFSGI